VPVPDPAGGGGIDEVDVPADEVRERGVVARVRVAPQQLQVVDGHRLHRRGSVRGKGVVTRKMCAGAAGGRTGGAAGAKPQAADGAVARMGAQTGGAAPRIAERS
jgi:hypothetical protein